MQISTLPVLLAVATLIGGCERPAEDGEELTYATPEQPASQQPPTQPDTSAKELLSKKPKQPNKASRQGVELAEFDTPTDRKQNQPTRSKQTQNVRSQARKASGTRVYWQAKKTLKLDYDKALELYLLSCQLGHIPGCHGYAWHMRKTNTKNAKNFFRVSCTKGLWKSCNNLGWLYENIGNLTQASNYYSWACLNKHPGSCQNLRRVRNIRMAATTGSKQSTTPRRNN